MIFLDSSLDGGPTGKAKGRCASTVCRFADIQNMSCPSFSREIFVRSPQVFACLSLHQLLAGQPIQWRRKVDGNELGQPSGDEDGASNKRGLHFD